MDLNKNVREFINENLLVFDDDAEFSDSDNIFELGFVNSLFAMKLVAYVENTFKIKVENTDLRLDNFNSVDNIVKFINSKTTG
jgi:acyl carrier protein